MASLEYFIENFEKIKEEEKLKEQHHYEKLEKQRLFMLNEKIYHDDIGLIYDKLTSRTTGSNKVITTTSTTSI